MIWHYLILKYCTVRRGTVKGKTKIKIKVVTFFLSENEHFLTLFVIFSPPVFIKLSQLKLQSSKTLRFNRRYTQLQLHFLLQVHKNKAEHHDIVYILHRHSRPKTIMCFILESGASRQWSHRNEVTVCFYYFCPRLSTCNLLGQCGSFSEPLLVVLFRNSAVSCCFAALVAPRLPLLGIWG